MRSNQKVVEELRWKKFPVLSDGFVTLVDVMGDDSSIVQAARVSYGNDEQRFACEVGDCFQGYKQTREEWSKGIQSKDHPCDKCQGSGFVNGDGTPWKPRDPKDDRNLIRYLMRHRHTTPFEMAEVKILVRVPMDCWRQWIRHRTANVNEYSTRYTEAIDSMDKTPVDGWRLQSDSNKQGSSGKLVPLGNNTGIAENLTRLEEEFHDSARKVYKHRIGCGIAREQARKDLPLSTYTEAYWKCDLHNILGFLALRMDSHAQLEIRRYATMIGEQIIKPLFPMVWEAFEDYRLGAMQLTRLDIEVVQKLQRLEVAAGMDRLAAYFAALKDFSSYPYSSIWPEEWRGKEKCRERDECIAKLKRLGLISE